MTERRSEVIRDGGEPYLRTTHRERRENMHHQRGNRC